MVQLNESLLGITNKIVEVKLFKYNVEAIRKFSFGTWTSRQHIFIAIKTNENTGYGENIITINTPDVSLDEWQSWSEQLIGLSISDAFQKIRANLGIWRDRYTEMAEMALLDLAGKERKVSALSLLGLHERHEVNGVPVILNDDPDFVAEKTQEAVDQKIAQIIKIKLFGDLEIDLAVIRAAKKRAPRETSYLIGDVNTGYRREGESAGIDEIADDLKRLYEAGLDACEDPAALSVDEWVELQGKVKPLSLIPDVIMRPSWESVKFIKKGMGDFYNIHPGSAGSILDALELAGKIESLGAKLMFGDDSLVGPACTGWQQLAMAMNASWVEAIEKTEDSDGFLNSVISCNTDSSRNPIALDEKVNGFGLVLDEKKLATACMEVRTVR